MTARVFYGAILAFFAAQAVPAFAQEDPPASPDTTQTDQSEEDWRKSQRKDDDDPFDPISNPQNTGMGTNVPPMRDIDRLPEESQRHLNRMHARVIAEVDLNNPEATDMSYEPSAAAQSDPQLRAEEEAAWAQIVNDIKSAGQGGQNGQSGQGAGQSGSGTMAGAGQGGGSDMSGGGGGGIGAGPSMGGGSNMSAAEILRQMQGLGGDAPSGQAGSTQADGQADTDTQPAAMPEADSASVGAGASDSAVDQPDGEAAPGGSEGGDPSGGAEGHGIEDAGGGGAEASDGSEASPGERDGAETSAETGQGDGPVEAGEADGEGDAPPNIWSEIAESLGQSGSAESDTSSSEAPDEGEAPIAEPGSTQQGADTQSAQQTVSTPETPVPPASASSKWLEIIHRALGDEPSEPQPVSDQPVAMPTAEKLAALRQRAYSRAD
ncbi:MAG: hypothetical protein MRY64_09540 [Hyphomonadaceae bacterium]|nr:hypothetical protein [Hyphomonadaceae bacterium]